jgi:hypothetical protein
LVFLDHLIEQRQRLDRVIAPLVSGEHPLARLSQQGGVVGVQDEQRLPGLYKIPHRVQDFDADGMVDAFLSSCPHQAYRGRQ